MALVWESIQVDVRAVDGVCMGVLENATYPALDALPGFAQWHVKVLITRGGVVDSVAIVSLAPLGRPGSGFCRVMRVRDFQCGSGWSSLAPGDFLDLDFAISAAGAI